jgi:hypothetical protein
MVSDFLDNWLLVLSVSGKLRDTEYKRKEVQRKFLPLCDSALMVQVPSS